MVFIINSKGFFTNKWQSIQPKIMHPHTSLAMRPFYSCIGLGAWYNDAGNEPCLDLG